MKLGYETFWAMSPREFFNAWEGHFDQREEDWEVLFYVAQYNAMRTAFSEKQQRAIQKDRPPWDSSKRHNEGVTAEQVVGMLSLISKPAEDGGT